MCQIAYVPQGQMVDYSLIPQIMVHNRDGVGFMWQKNDRVHVSRGFFTVSEVILKAKQLADRNLTHAIHWRKATIGRIIHKNIHPYKILKDDISGLEIYGMLNGTLTQIQINNDDDCDARLLMHNILAPIFKHNSDRIRDPKFLQLLESAIGTARILLMTPRETVLVNENKGHWIDGVWYSNKYSNAPIRKMKNSYSYYSNNQSTAAKQWDQKNHKWVSSPINFQSMY